MWVAEVPFNVVFWTGSICHERLTILPFSLHNCPVSCLRGECANEGCRLPGIADMPEEKSWIEENACIMEPFGCLHVYKVNRFIRAIRYYEMKNLSLY